jgi:hypothetical protein
MRSAGRQARRASVPGIELLESRSLLSNLDPGFPVADSVDTLTGDKAQFSGADFSISPELARPVTLSPNQIVAIAQGSRGLSISIVEPPSVLSGKAASGELVIEVTGQGIQCSAGVGKAYLEDGWIVIELPIPLEDQTGAEGNGSSYEYSDPPSSPFVLQQHPSKRNARNELVLSGIRTTADMAHPDSQIPGPHNVASQHAAEGLSSGQIPETLVNDGNARNLNESQDRQPLASPFSPVLTLDARSSLDKRMSDSEIVESSDAAVVTQVPRTESVQRESDVRALDITQQPAKTSLRSDSEGMVAESVKGIKIRAAYVDPANATQSGRVVDLAVIQFEKPITVRLQLPFVLEAEHEMITPVSEFSVSGASGGSIVERIDAVLTGVENAVSGSDLNWQVSGGVAILAAAVGYLIGSRRGQPLESQICAVPSEPFIPVFSEAQLSRLSRRLGGTTRKKPQPEAQGLNRGSRTGDWPNSWLAGRVAIAGK